MSLGDQEFFNIAEQIEKDLTINSEIFQAKEFSKNNFIFANDLYDVFDETDCVVIITEWEIFSKIDWVSASKTMRQPGWVFDTRSIVNHKQVKQSGLNLWALGIESE